ncbi:MAG TPA: ABC transporter permease, partial [Longimicrobium sp.]|nr:ABC transporter permease [Longimicrobium sp.]
MVVINQAMAKRVFGRANPVGRRIRYDVGPMKSADAEVVGVVEDAVYRSLREGGEATLYVALRQQP